MATATSHTAESRIALEGASAALERDDVPGAAALIWDAAACAMRSIAETRGWEREDEHDLVNAGFMLARETGVGDISTLVTVAHTGPWLVDEGWIDKKWIARDVGEIEELLTILDSLDIEPRDARG